MVPNSACIQGVLKVKVKGHVIRGLLWCHVTRFFLQADSWSATKLAHDRSQPGLHPGCAQRQGLCQRSRYTGTLLKDALKVKVEVKGYVIGALVWFHKNCFFSPGNGWIMAKLSYYVTMKMHFDMRSLYEAPLHSPSHMSIRQLDQVLEWATPSLTV